MNTIHPDSIVAHARNLARERGQLLDPDALQALTFPTFTVLLAGLSHAEAIWVVVYCATMDYAIADRIAPARVDKGNAVLRAAVAGGLSTVARQQKLVGDRIVQEVASLAFFDWGEVPAETFQTGDVSKLPPNVRRGIKKIKTTAVGVELEAWDKVRALDLLHKMMGSPAVEATDFGAPHNAKEEVETREQVQLVVIEPGRLLPREIDEQPGDVKPEPP